MKIVEQIFQSPEGKLYTFDKAHEENAYFICDKQDIRFDETTGGPKMSLLCNGWVIIVSCDDNPGYSVESYSRTKDVLKRVNDAMYKINEDSRYMLRGNPGISTVLEGGESIG